MKSKMVKNTSRSNSAGYIDSPHHQQRQDHGLGVNSSCFASSALSSGLLPMPRLSECPWHRGPPLLKSTNPAETTAPPAIFIASCPMCLCWRSPLHGQRMNPISSCLTYLKIISSLLVKVGSGDTPPNLSIEKGAPHVSRSATSCIPMPFACNIRSLAAGNDLFICNSRCEPSRQLEYP